MHSNTEQGLEVLFNLLETREDLSAEQIIEVWRADRKKARDEHAARMRQMALDSIYPIARVDTVQIWDDLRDEVKKVVRPVERIAVRYGDLGQFAKEHGLKLEELMDVLEFRRLEVTAKGKTWRSGDRNRHFEERTVEQSDSQEMQKEFIGDSQEHAASVAKRNALKLSIGKYVEPQVKEWRKN